MEEKLDLMTETAFVILTNNKDCPYCIRAKGLLERFNLPFTYVVFDKEGWEQAKEVIARYNPDFKTVPQIFRYNKEFYPSDLLDMESRATFYYVGGCSELENLLLNNL